MNVYEEIDQETMMLLLNSLCKRTVEGKQIWEIWSIILFPFYNMIFSQMTYVRTFLVVANIIWRIFQKFNQNIKTFTHTILPLHLF